MSKRNGTLGIALCCVALLFGCEESGALDDVPASAPPLPLESALLYAHQEGARGEAWILDISGRKPKITVHGLSLGKVRSYPRPGSAGREVVVLTQGTPSARGGKRRDAVNSSLVVFDRDGERVRKELSGRFTDVTLSPDGRTAVVHGHGEGTGVDVGNTVAFVDLEDPNAAPRNMALSDSSGRAMDSFAFPEPGDGSRRLVLARGSDAFSVVELDHLERDPIEIPVKLPSDSRALSPGKILFRADEIFVQLENSSDILVLQLVPDESRGPEGFRVAPLFLATGSNVRDFELIGEGGAERRLVALGQASVSMVDPVTGDASSVASNSRFVELLPFVGKSPVDDAPRERGLLVQTGGQAIGFVDFGALQSFGKQSVETLWLPNTIESVTQLAHHRLAVLVYKGEGIGLVDLERRKVTPIGTGAPVSSTLVDESAAQARLWFTSSDGKVAWVDLLQLESHDIALAEPAQELLMLAGTPRQLAAIHSSPGGFITLLDPEDPAQERIRELASFFYTDILD